MLTVIACREDSVKIADQHNENVLQTFKGIESFRTSLKKGVLQLEETNI